MRIFQKNVKGRIGLNWFELLCWGGSEIGGFWGNFGLNFFGQWGLKSDEERASDLIGRSRREDWRLTGLVQS